MHTTCRCCPSDATCRCCLLHATCRATRCHRCHSGNERRAAYDALPAYAIFADTEHTLTCRQAVRQGLVAARLEVCRSVATLCRCGVAACGRCNMRRCNCDVATCTAPHAPPRVNTHSCSARVRSRGGSRRMQAASAAPRGSAASPPSGSCPARRSAKGRARASETSRLAMGALCRQRSARCLVAVVAADDAQRRAVQKTGGGQHADAGGASIVPAQKW